MLFADGTIARAPIATCEIQGYVYDAQAARRAPGPRGLGRRGAGATGSSARRPSCARASTTTSGFPSGGYYALALDGDKRQVDSLTSNIGHLLWSGIVDRRARRASWSRHLMSERLFSGWGVRTMAEGDAGYNPIEYHNGTVWPHDNSLIAAGLAALRPPRRGARDRRWRSLEAATHFEYRLPEVFAGYPRALTGVPVEYPTASRAAGLVDRDAAAAPADAARPRAGGRPS